MEQRFNMSKKGPNALYTGIDNQKALQHYETAMKLAASVNDKATIAINIDRLKKSLDT